MLLGDVYIMKLPYRKQLYTSQYYAWNILLFFMHQSASDINSQIQCIIKIISLISLQ